jgi:hypothetical protein
MPTHADAWPIRQARDFALALSLRGSGFVNVSQSEIPAQHARRQRRKRDNNPVLLLKLPEML